MNNNEEILKQVNHSPRTQVYYNIVGKLPECIHGVESDTRGFIITNILDKVDIPIFLARSNIWDMAIDIDGFSPMSLF